MWGATKTFAIVRFRTWKKQIQSWMEITAYVRTQLKSALSWLAKEVSACLQFKIMGGACPVLQQEKRLISMARVINAVKTAEEGLGQTMFTHLEVGKISFDVCAFYGSICNYVV